MKRFAYLFPAVVMILAVGNAVSDDPTEEWVARYNGPGNDGDYARSIAVDGDGNVYVTGYSDFVLFNCNYDYATIKYNSDGIEQWVNRYNGAGNGWDQAYSIALDADGNVYVTGYSVEGGTCADYTTIKYNSDGVEQWVTHYNGPGNHNDRASSIALDRYGNVYVTGYSNGSGTWYDYATIKYDNDGVEQWVARYNGPADSLDYARSITLDADGNVYVTGESIFGGSTGYDYATIKYNNDGEEQWVARYEGNKATSIAVDGDGNVYVTGRVYNSASFYDYATIKYDDDGVEQWVALYDGPRNILDEANSIALDGDGNIFVTGRSTGIDTYNDYATIKYSNDGVEQWVARYDGPGNSSDVAHSIVLDGDGNIFVTGSSTGIDTNSDYATIKYSNDGVEQWVVRYNGPLNQSDEASSIVLDGAGNVYVTGRSVGDGTSKDYATIKYSQETGIEVVEIDLEFNIQVHPCPVSTTASVVVTLPEPSECSVLVYSLDGRLVETLHRGALPEGEYSFIWQTSQIPVGVYLFRASAGSIDIVSRVAVIN